MTSARATRIFRSGNSKAVRLPADWPVEVGEKVVLRREGSRYVIEPADRKIDLSSIAGSVPWLAPLSDEERELAVRDLPW